MVLWRQIIRRLHIPVKINRDDCRPVIGLEVHVQLATATKLFSRAPVAEDAGPNSRVAPFDMAIPGVLPALNRKAVMYALRMANILNCKIPTTCRFDRKHYFYADMPAGYQITQSSCPIALDGSLDIYVFGEHVQPYTKMIEIIQLQLEQDSGKTIHHGSVSLVDLNRAGIALVEVVTAPCFSTALEAVCFIQQLRLLLMHYGICDGELHKGHMRVDANVSLSQGDIEGVRTEIKNMNSLRHLHTAVNYEINRQFEIISDGGVVINETRACDPLGRTVSMRDKEEETDYRIIPEPNLPTLRIAPEWVKEAKNFILSSKPLYLHFIAYGFDVRTAVHYAEDPLLSSFVKECFSVNKSLNAEIFQIWLKELKLILQRSKEVFPPQRENFHRRFVEVISFFASNKITKLRAIDALRQYATSDDNVTAVQIFESRELWKITDQEMIDEIVRQVLQREEKISRKAATGNMKALNKLRTSVIEYSNKRIEVIDVESTIRKLVLMYK